MRYIVELNSRTGDAGFMGSHRLHTGPWASRELARRWLQRHEEVLKDIDWQGRVVALRDPASSSDLLSKAHEKSFGGDLY